jgi:putative ABC transport system substrate-binding protein
MRRREFIVSLGGVAVAWPLSAQAQGPNRLRRIGAMMPEAESAIESLARKTAFEKALSESGWQSGGTIAIDYRWDVSDLERARAATAELLGLNPDLILAVATPAAKAAQAATRTIPIVFIGVSEPVAQGFVTSLARPGGNITGLRIWNRHLAQSKSNFSRKWHRSSTMLGSYSILARRPMPHYSRAPLKKPLKGCRLKWIP